MHLGLVMRSALKPGDERGKPVPADRYPAGDPRNDPEFEREHDRLKNLTDRYVGIDIRGINAEARKARDAGGRLGQERLTGLIAQYKQHQSDLRAGLGGATDELYDRLDSETGAHDLYRPERKAVHDKILDEMEQDARTRGVPRDHKAIILGGPSGGGKTSMLREHGADLGIRWVPGQEGAVAQNYVTLNPDDLKERLAQHFGPADLARYPGLRPNELSGLLHEESSTLAKRAASRFMSQGYNVVHDGTLSNADRAHQHFLVGGNPADPYAARYDYTHAFVDAPIEQARHGAGLRWKAPDKATGERTWSGRAVAMDVVDRQAPTMPGYRSRNAQESERFAAHPAVRNAYVYDTPTGTLRQTKKDGQGQHALRHPVPAVEVHEPGGRRAVAAFGTVGDVSSVIVTPTLFLGDAPALSRTATVSTPGEAVEIVLCGGVAVLPEGRWDLADQTLALLGVGQPWRDRQLRFAKTGMAASGTGTSAIHGKVEDFRAGRMSRDALVRYLTREHQYTRPPGADFRHDYATRMSDTTPEHVPDSWDDVEHAHESGRLPDDVYREVYNYLVQHAAGSGQQ